MSAHLGRRQRYVQGLILGCLVTLTPSPLTAQQAKLRQTIDRAHTVALASVAFSPDGKVLASCAGGTIMMWDVVTGKNTATFKGNVMIVSVVAFSPDGKILASGTLAGTIELWDVSTGKIAATLEGHAQDVRSI